MMMNLFANAANVSEATSNLGQRNYAPECKSKQTPVHDDNEADDRNTLRRKLVLVSAKLLATEKRVGALERRHAPALATNNASNSTMPRQQRGADMLAVLRVIDLFFAKYCLSKKPTLQENLAWMAKAIGALSEDNQLELLLQISEQKGDTEYLKLVAYQNQVVRQLQMEDPESKAFQQHIATLDNIAELQAHSRFEEEKAAYEQLELFEKIVCLVPQCAELHAKFSQILCKLDVVAAAQMSDENSRWELLMRNTSAGTLSYPFLKRILNMSLRLKHLVHTNETLDTMAQAPSFRFSSLMHEEALPMLHTLIQNTFTTEEAVDAKAHQRWFNTLKKNTQDGVKSMYEHVLSAKPMSAIYKSTYGFVRSSFLQKQERAKLPAITSKAALRKVETQLAKEQQLLANEHSIQKRGAHKSKIQVLKGKHDEAKELVRIKMRFPYGEAQFEEHCAWLKSNPNCKDIFEAFGEAFGLC